MDLTEILQQLKREGYLIDPEDIKTLSPKWDVSIISSHNGILFQRKSFSAIANLFKL